MSEIKRMRRDAEEEVRRSSLYVFEKSGEELRTDALPD